MKSLDTNGLDELFSLKKSIDREINKVMLDGIPNLFEVYKCSKLSAVKLVKHYTGLGLVESKNFLMKGLDDVLYIRGFFNSIYGFNYMGS
jgi:hypothetical protein